MIWISKRWDADWVSSCLLYTSKEANDVLAWEKLQQMMEDGTVVKVRIKESVPSGVVAFLEGIRAFIPASQLALDYVENKMCIRDRKMTKRSVMGSRFS